MEECKVWFKIIKREKPKWGEFFKHDIQEYLDETTLDIFGASGETIEEVIKRRKEYNKKRGYPNREFPTYNEDLYYYLPRKYNIPMNAAEFIFESYKGPNPIKDIESYNKAIRADLEARQKAKQKARTSGNRTRGQRKQYKQPPQKKTRSQRQATSQRKQNEQARRDRERREDEQRRFRNERRGF